MKTLKDEINLRKGFTFQYESDDTINIISNNNDEPINIKIYDYGTSCYCINIMINNVFIQNWCKKYDIKVTGQ